MNTSAIVRAGATFTAASALVLVGVLSPATAASSTAKIKGVVTVNGKPISFAKVQIFPYLPDDGGDEARVGERRKTDNTDSAGRFSFSGVKATSTVRRYAVLVTDRKGRTVTTYRDVSVKSGRTTTKNVHMRPAAILTGTIATSDGRSPAGLTVDTEPGNVNDFGPTHDKLYPPFSTTVRADGTFTLAGIDGTQYEHIRVSDGPSVQQCYDFVGATLTDCATKSDQAPAYYERQRLTVAGGEQRTLPAVTMTKFAPPVTQVTGRVTDTSDKALKGIRVRMRGTSARTRSSGRFTLRQTMASGPTTVTIEDPRGVWATTRRTVTVTAGRPIRGLDADLKSRATAKIASKGGAGTAKVAVAITRKATGSAPAGTLTLSFEGVTKTVDVVKGRATLKLSGIRPGTRRLVATYSGTSSTEGFSKTVKVVVR